MSDTFPVFEALRTLGFADRGDWGVTFVHPQCEVSAVEACIPYPAVSFAGHFNHQGRVMGHLEFNLLDTVESLEQLKAFLAYYMRDAITADPPQWFSEGRALSHLLPWQRQRGDYETRDRCFVRRAWLKLALKELALALKDPRAAKLATISFDGTLLSIDCGSWSRTMVQASGSAWQSSYTLPTNEFARLPSRLMRDPVEVAACAGHLKIGNLRYPLVSPNQGGSVSPALPPTASASADAQR